MSKGGGGVTVYEYRQTLVLLCCKGPMKRLRRLWAGSDVFYDDRPEQVGWSSRPMTSDGRRPAMASWMPSANVEVYLGTQTQGRSPTIEALLGTANTQAWRGRMVVVLKDFPRHKFGGGLPTFSFEAESTDTDDNGRMELGLMMGKILAEANYPVDKYDFSALAGIKCDGMKMSQQDEARRYLDGLQSAYLFDFALVDYKLVAIPRGATPSVTIDPYHMGTGTPDAQPVAMQSVRAQSIELPDSVTVVYQSASIDFQNFSQTTRSEASQKLKKLSQTVPVVMTENDAMALARRTKASVRAAQESHKTTLPWVYAPWHPGMVVHVPLEDGGTIITRITDYTIGLIGHIEMAMVGDDPDAYTYTGEGSASPGTGSGAITDGPAIIYVADLPSLVNQDDASFDGCSLIVVCGSPKSSWGGGLAKCQAKIRSVDGSMKELITTHTVSGSLAKLTASIAAYRGPNVWDTVSTITLQMASVFTAYAVPVGTNVGNGIIEMQDPPVNGGVIQGNYLVEYTSTTAFTVKDPNGATIGSGSNGTVFSIEVCFKITVGSTAFAIGDRFTVTAGPTGAVIGQPPQGATDIDVLNGANVLTVGGEVIQFAQVTDLGNNTYRLARLLRGRRGTEHIAWVGHSSGTWVAFLPDTAAVQRFKANLSERTNSKTVAIFENGVAGRNYTNTQNWTVSMQANARLPWSPGCVHVARATDAVIDWEYRSRWGDDLRNGSGTVRMGETVEKYDLEVWDSTFTTLLRTVNGLTASTYTYTGANQTTDGVAASSFGVVLYQVSALVGRGFPRRVVVP